MSKVFFDISMSLDGFMTAANQRMFEHLGDQHIQLEPAAAVQTAAATHLRFRIAR
jgi:hypothetical protein